MSLAPDVAAGFGVRRLDAALSNGGLTPFPVPNVGDGQRRKTRAPALRDGDSAAEAVADALYWERLPIDERAELVWQRSVELHRLAHPEA